MEEIKLINYSKLKTYGLNEIIEKEFSKGHSDMVLGRVVIQNRGSYNVVTEEEEVLAVVSGKMMNDNFETGDYPAVGDWVVLDRNSNKTGDAIIHKILTRKSKLSRKAAGNRLDEQIIAANISKIFICMALNNDFNLGRLERYITLAWDSGAMPYIILTKADLCEDLETKKQEVEEIACGIEISVISAIDDLGIEEIKKIIKEKDTIAFVGSSGVGKSTLINKLIGEDFMKVNGLRDDDKGRHTTTHRELIKLPTGGVVIDTPGMREIQLYSADIDKSFKDIEDLAKNCRFSDCKHDSEPKCAVKEAINNGELTKDRLVQYNKQKKELAYFENKKNLNQRQQEKQKVIGMVGSLSFIKDINHR
jgi:ribosome biogenesis GTPase